MLEFYNNTCALNVNIICLTETWMSPLVDSNDLIPSAYKVYRKDRVGRRGGGVILAIDNAVSSKDLNLMCNVPDIDLIGVSVKLRSKSIVMICVYVPPGLSVQLYTEFYDYLDSIADRGESKLIIGDFNIPRYKECFASGNLDSFTAPMIDFLNFNNLAQCNTICNNNNRLLDLILYSDIHSISVHRSASPLVTEDSHHPALDITLKSLALPASNMPLSTNYTKFDFKSANLNDLYHEIGLISWKDLYSSYDVDFVTEIFYNKLYTAIHKHVPIKPLNHKFQNFPIWFTISTIKLIRTKNNIARRLRKKEQAFLRQRINNLKRTIKRDIQEDYQVFISNTANEIKHNPNRLWSYVKQRRNSSRIPSRMNYNDAELNNPEAIVNAFAAFFSETFAVSSDSSVELPSANTEHLHISGFNDDEFAQAIKKIKANLTSGSDNIPAFLLKDCASYFKEPLLYIYNLCMSTSTYPMAWKMSKVIPVFKSGDSALVTNYRPISLLCNFAKILEILLSNHILQHMSKYLSTCQHGFTNGRSTVTNLVQFTSNISYALNNRSQVDVIYLDFTKAFDKVPHATLLGKLKRYGFSNCLINFFISYFSARGQYVHCNGYSSNVSTIASGVVQGSNLGPVMFALFINDIVDKLSAQTLLYADDVKVYSTVKDVFDCLQLQSNLDNIQKWCIENGLALNKDKCKVMSFTRSHRSIHFAYNIKGFALEHCETIKDLGVYFVPSLNFNYHCDQLTAKCTKLLGFIKRNSKDFKDIHCLLTLYRAFVLSILDYASIVWSPYHQNRVNQLERIQRRLVKTVYYTQYNVYPDFNIVDYSEFLATLNLHKLDTRRDCTQIIFIYKLFNNLIYCPELLGEFNIRVPRIGSRCNDFFSYSTPKTSQHQNSPIISACRAFNKLARDLDITIQPLASFKSQLLSICKP